MTSLDFGPFYRSAIGFDRVVDLLQDRLRSSAVDTYPPYDIEKTGEQSYRITVAVAGFAPDDLTITAQPNLLVLTGKPAPQRGGQYLHQGITGRGFERRFDLADFVRVSTARLEHGLLTIDLVREVPEALKPRRIDISTAPHAPRTIDSAAA